MGASFGPWFAGWAVVSGSGPGCSSADDSDLLQMSPLKCINMHLIGSTQGKRLTDRNHDSAASVDDCLFC